jgi:hypothetical protein
VTHLDPLIADDIEAYLEHHEHKSLLRFITCGSVDDGKSTLIGRFLYESKLVFEDHLAALEADSNGNRASPSTSPTGSSPPSDGSSWWPTHPVTSSTRATW